MRKRHWYFLALVLFGFRIEAQLPTRPLGPIDSIGLYALPASIMGASFCRVVRSDDLMATLAIYHQNGAWSVRGYHHCRDSSPEQTGLLALEAMIDSLALRPRKLHDRD